MLQIENLVFHYPNSPTIIDRVSFSANRHEIVGLLGQNGSGKSTILQLVAGNLKGDEGRIVWEGRPTSSRDVKRSILYLTGNERLPAYLTGKELITLYAALYGSTITDSDIVSLAARYQIETSLNTLIETYSHGMKKKLQLVVALLLKLPLTIVDETLNGLDYGSIIKAKEDLKGLAKHSLVILVSHDVQVLNGLVNRVICLEGARVAVDERLSPSGNNSQIISKLLEQYLNREAGSS